MPAQESQVKVSWIKAKPRSESPASNDRLLSKLEPSELPDFLKVLQPLLAGLAPKGKKKDRPEPASRNVLRIVTVSLDCP